MDTQKISDTGLGYWLARLVRRTAAPRPRGIDITAIMAPVETLPAWLPEPEVSDVVVARILRSCFLECELTDAETLRCRTLAGMRFFVALRGNSRMLHMLATFAVLPAERREESERAAQRVNDSLLMGRAAIDRDGDLVMDAAISFAGGLAPAQLMHVIAVFERSCLEARYFFPSAE